MSHNIQRKAKRINTQILCKDSNASTQWGCDNRTIAKEQLEKLQICKMSYIQEYTCEFEEYYYKIFGTTSLFPRISIFPNEIPSFTAQLFEFGYLDRVYTRPDLKELSKLPERLFEAVKNFAQGNGVYCRFYSISMECQDLQAYYPTLNYISIEKIKDFNVKATGVDKKLPHLNKKWIQTKRAFSL